MHLHREHRPEPPTRGSFGMVLLILGLMLSGLGLLQVLAGAIHFGFSRMAVPCLLLAPLAYLVLTAAGMVSGSLLFMHRQQLLGFILYACGLVALYLSIAGQAFTSGWCPLALA